MSFGPTIATSFARRNPHGIALRLGRVCLMIGLAAGHVLVALTIGGAR